MGDEHKIFFSRLSFQLLKLIEEEEEAEIFFFFDKKKKPKLILPIWRNQGKIRNKKNKEKRMTYSNKTVSHRDLFVHDIIFRSALSYFPRS